MKLDDLKARLELIAAWHKPGGPTPKEVMPNRTKTCLEAVTAITDLEALVGELGEALAAMVTEEDDDPCWFDHHGNCQAHCLNNPCEMAAARATLAKLEKARG